MQTVFNENSRSFVLAVMQTVFDEISRRFLLLRFYLKSFHMSNVSLSLQLSRQQYMSTSYTKVINPQEKERKKTKKTLIICSRKTKHANIHNKSCCCFFLKQELSA